MAMKNEVKNLSQVSEKPVRPSASQEDQSRFRTWWSLSKKIWRLSRQHDILGRAAQLGFYFLLALFPALLGLTALVGMLPIQSILPRLLGYSYKVLPQESLFLVEDYFRQIS